MCPRYKAKKHREEKVSKLIPFDAFSAKKLRLLVQKYEELKKTKAEIERVNAPILKEIETFESVEKTKIENHKTALNKSIEEIGKKTDSYLQTLSGIQDEIDRLWLWGLFQPDQKKELDLRHRNLLNSISFERKKMEGLEEELFQYTGGSRKGRYGTQYYAPKISAAYSPLRQKLIPFDPKSKYTLKDGNLSRKVDLLDPSFSIEKVREILRKKEEKEHKIHESKALAAAYQDKTRAHAAKLKKSLTTQMKTLDYCPYCGNPYSETNAVLDHIYPVSKGGLSTPKNLVFICAGCNSKKKDKTLREFIIQSGLNRAEIEKNLDLLKKSF